MVYLAQADACHEALATSASHSLPTMRRTLGLVLGSGTGLLFLVGAADWGFEGRNDRLMLHHTTDDDGPGRLTLDSGLHAGGFTVPGEGRRRGSTATTTTVDFTQHSRPSPA